MTTPGPLNIPGAHLLTVNMSQQGQPAAVVLGARTVNDSQVLTVAEAQSWLNEFWARFRATMHSSVVCTGGTYRTLSSAPFAYELPAPTTTPNGGDQTAAAIAGACVLIKWKTDLATRSGRGRTFLPGLPLAQIDTDLRSYKATYRTGVQSAIDAYLGSTVLSGIGLKPSVVSRKTATVRTIVSGTMPTVVALQRRRMRA